ncbi:MAG TPA: hypothetical protein VFI16_08915 [Anaeromyxobacteraceae bacterium]|nr:hypothetical protein [Anaeromyxobacteraceae bacterium]
MKRYARTGLFALGLLAAVALALPVVRAGGSSGCEPKDWMDWHLAMRQECLEPRYVCEHMTSAEMLRDPQIAAAYREGLTAGRPEPVRGLSRMVGQMRAMYGCEPEDGAGPEAGAAWSPDRLPPGHPPVGGSCPFAGPDAGRGARSAGPLPFAFESAPTITL